MSPTIHHIIPEGEQYCIWMDAGVADYKLCDRRFACDECPFDAQIRTRHTEPRRTDTPPVRPTPVHRNDTVGSSGSAADYCAATLQNFLDTVKSRGLPKDRLYSSNHTWAKADDDGLFVVGIDHFIGSMLAAAHSVAFSVPPAHMKASEPFAWIVANGETLAVRSPIAGTIVENNTALAKRSAVIHSDPYRLGWLAKIRPENHASAQALRRREDAMERLLEDCDRYEHRIQWELQRLQIPLEGTMYDGGTVLENFEDILGTKNYYAILERFLRR